MDGAFAVVEFEVGELHGPTVKLEKGSASYDRSTADGEFPSLVVRSPEVVAVIDQSRTTEVEALEREAKSERGLVLRYSQGIYERGERYALFIGNWGDEGYSVLYAHSLKDDWPIDGFAMHAAEPLERLGFEARPANDLAGDGRVLTQLIAGSKEFLAARQNGDELGASALALANTTIREEVPLRGSMDSTYPVDEDEATAEEQATLVPIEITIITDGSVPTDFVVVGQKNLGWFRTNDAGIAIVSGLVSPDDDLSLYARPVGDTKNDPTPVRDVPSFRAGKALNVVDGSEPDGLLIDVTAKTVVRYDSYTEYLEKRAERPGVVGSGEIMTEEAFAEEAIK